MTNERGSTRPQKQFFIIINTLADTLMRSDALNAAGRLHWWILRNTYGFQRLNCRLDWVKIAAETGVNRTTGFDALSRLKEANLVSQKGDQLNMPRHGEIELMRQAQDVFGSHTTVRKTGQQVSGKPDSKCPENRTGYPENRTVVSGKPDSSVRKTGQSTDEPKDSLKDKSKDTDPGTTAIPPFPTQDQIDKMPRTPARERADRMWLDFMSPEVEWYTDEGRTREHPEPIRVRAPESLIRIRLHLFLAFVRHSPYWSRIAPTPDAVWKHRSSIMAQFLAEDESNDLWYRGRTQWERDRLDLERRAAREAQQDAALADMPSQGAA